MRLFASFALIASALTQSVAYAADDTDAPAVSDEVIQLAQEVEVDPIDLQGASFTTGLSPRQYLIVTGVLAPPPPPIPSIVGPMARVDCIISKESGGLDIPNRRGSGANGPGQYFQGTWARHVALYRAATGYTGPLSLHSLADVRRVMGFMLLKYPGSRSEWSVGGC